MSRRNTVLAYAIEANDPKSGDMRPMAVLSCANCPNTGRLSVAGFGNNPERIEQQFIRVGWECDVHHPKQNFCPTCVKRRKIMAEQVAASRVSKVLPTIPPMAQSSLDAGYDGIIRPGPKSPARNRDRKCPAKPSLTHQSPPSRRT